MFSIYHQIRVCVFSFGTQYERNIRTGFERIGWTPISPNPIRCHHIIDLTHDWPVDVRQFSCSRQSRRLSRFIGHFPIPIRNERRSFLFDLRCEIKEEPAAVRDPRSENPPVPLLLSVWFLPNTCGSSWAALREGGRGWSCRWWNSGRWFWRPSASPSPAGSRRRPASIPSSADWSLMSLRSSKSSSSSTFRRFEIFFLGY